MNLTCRGKLIGAALTADQSLWAALPKYARPYALRSDAWLLHARLQEPGECRAA